MSTPDNDDQVAVMICNRVPEALQVDYIGTCDRCGEKVALSKSSLDILKAVPDHQPSLRCMQCVSPEELIQYLAEGSLQPPTEAQLKEVRKIMKRLGNEWPG